MAITTPTTIDRFGDALMAMLAASADLAGVPIVFGPPPPGTLDAPKWIALLDLEFEQAPRAMDVTTKPKLETYTQEVLISVVQQTRTLQSAVDADALAIFATIASIVRSNPAMTGYFTGDGQIRSLELTRGKLSRRANDRQRECSIDGDLEVKALI